MKGAWEDGLEKARKAIIERKKTDSTENILFDAWSDTVQKIFAALDDEEG